MSIPINQDLRPRILYAEDEKHIAVGVIYNLEKQGYAVEAVDRGDLALESASTQTYDLIILDVMMPELDGFDVCTELRKRKILTPILMLTARHETENRIKGITLGADDYLGKPFDLGELLVRVEALLRRRKWDDNRPTLEAISRISIGPSEFGITLDVNLLQLSAKQKVVPLTVIESKLLHLLINEYGKPVSRAQILKKVWGFHEDTQTRTLDNFIMRLRAHLNEVGGSPEWIESVRGVGYRLNC